MNRSKSLPLINNLKELAIKAKSPQMDNSHQIDPNELSRLVNELYMAVQYDCKLTAKNVRHKAIDVLLEFHPLGPQEVSKQIMNIQFDNVSPFK